MACILHPEAQEPGDRKGKRPKHFQNLRIMAKFCQNYYFFGQNIEDKKEFFPSSPSSHGAPASMPPSHPTYTCKREQHPYTSIQFIHVQAGTTPIYIYTIYQKFVCEYAPQYFDNAFYLLSSRGYYRNPRNISIPVYHFPPILDKNIREQELSDFQS